MSKLDKTNNRQQAMDFCFKGNGIEGKAAVNHHKDQEETICH